VSAVVVLVSTCEIPQAPPRYGHGSGTPRACVLPEPHLANVQHKQGWIRLRW
jgi:hypothetical protein